MIGTDSLSFIYLPQSIHDLKPQVDDLTRSSNNIYNYVNSMSNSLRERQRVVNGGRSDQDHVCIMRNGQSDMQDMKKAY